MVKEMEAAPSGVCLMNEYEVGSLKRNGGALPFLLHHESSTISVYN